MNYKERLFLAAVLGFAFGMMRGRAIVPQKIHQALEDFGIRVGQGINKLFRK